MKRLREWRTDRRLTVFELAGAAGVAVLTLTDMEKGRRLPQYRSMRAVSRALNVDPLEIEEFAEAIEERSYVLPPFRYAEHPM